jgi:acyl carrier protein
MKTGVAIAVAVVLAVGVGCRRKADTAAQAQKPVAARQVPAQSVPRLLRAAVGRSLAVDVNRLDPDVPIVTVKPDMDDLDVVELVLSLEEVFGVSIEDDALIKVTGGTNGAVDNKKVTLKNLWQLVETARSNVKQTSSDLPAPAPPGSGR